MCVPVAVVLRLQPVAPALVPRSHGALTRGAAYRLIDSLDPIRNRAVHDEDRSLPFTAGPLRGTFAPGKGPNGEHRVVPGRVYEWRLTGLDEWMTQLLRRIEVNQHVWFGEPDRPGAARFVVEAVARTEQEHAEAGEVSCEDLMRHSEHADPHSLRHVRLRFVTPTVFRSEWNLPLPHLVFGGLLAQWNKHGPLPFNDRRDELDRRIAITEWSDTRLVPVYVARGNSQVGVLGAFTYAVTREASAVDPDFRRRLATLAHYAFFAGAGYQTSQGFGQVRPDGVGAWSTARLSRNPGQDYESRPSPRAKRPTT